LNGEEGKKEEIEGRGAKGQGSFFINLHKKRTGGFWKVSRRSPRKRALGGKGSKGQQDDGKRKSTKEKKRT